METAKDRRKILFLCTGNSARSIFAEYLMNKIGSGRFLAYSAGSDPAGTVNPSTIHILKQVYGIDAGTARSKSWNEFKDKNFDIVITVCDKARQTCPVFPGQPAAGRPLGHPRSCASHWNGRAEAASVPRRSPTNPTADRAALLVSR